MIQAVKLWAAVPFAMVVWGCGQGSAPTAPPETSKPGVASADQVSGPLPAPDFTKLSDFGVLADDSATRVHVGDDAQTFKAAFTRPVQTSRSLIDLPLGASADHWTVNGWEDDNASRGVGALLYDGKIALVMRQFDNVPQEFVDTELARYKSLMPGEPQQVEGKHVNYWFWQDSPVTLMVCRFTNAKGQTNLTAACGDSEVMSHLRMDVATALSDRTAVERMYGVGYGSNSAVHPG